MARCSYCQDDVSSDWTGKRSPCCGDALLKCAVKYCKPGQLCGICEGALINGSSNPGYLSVDWKIDPIQVKKAGKEFNMKTPELYPENLETLKHIMARVPLLANIEGVHELEIRVRVDDLDTWAVIGYGETGDPCLLRFEPK